jgi:hypothetical protein
LEKTIHGHQDTFLLDSYGIPIGKLGLLGVRYENVGECKVLGTGLVSEEELKKKKKKKKDVKGKDKHKRKGKDKADKTSKRSCK